ncbi:MAG TPA: DUF4349 domain-containing protein [Candidatus Dormibacteraeota bacterium]|jgi:hypothetical protein
MSKTLPRLLIGAIAVALVAACGAGSVASGSPRSTAGGSSSTGTGAAAQAVTAPAVNGKPQDAVKAPGTTITDVVPPIGEGPRVIRTAQIAVEVKNGSFDSTVDKLFALSTNLGGYISGSVANADTGSLRTGTITFQVPTDKFNEAVTQVRALGTVQNLAIGGQDVSAQYVDLQARLKNAEAQQQAMLALLGQAKTVPDIIAIQNQLGSITAQIEQLKGQIAYYDHATSFSTISASIHEAAVALKPANTDTWGVTAALLQGLHGFVNTLDYVLVGVGYAGPVLVLLAFGFAAWRLRRRFAM